ncbi:hypothetical protein [Chromohalobacter israelensis]
MPIEARYHEQVHEATTLDLDQGKISLLELPANGAGGHAGQLDEPLDGHDWLGGRDLERVALFHVVPASCGWLC